MENSTLTHLNLESNVIQPAGMREIANMLKVNQGLEELKLSNQKYPTGTDAEQSFATALAQNQKITKLGLLIRDVASRTSVDRAIARNKDLLRKKRQP